ncbi:MAG: RNA polymerase sigma factor, partial [Kangiellaceae bacterium]|nr:RNA polymerase sigma factor [Kangiellaceae bacterium]
KAAKNGEIDALELIYRTYSDAAYTLALRICREPSLAQDVVQDVFIKVMKSIHSFREEGAFAGWIRRIVSNETINRIRRQNHLQLVNDEQISNLASESLFEQEWLMATRDLDSMLGKLTESARAVLVLHEIEGYSHKEIGDMFEKSESFSKVTLSRAYKALKKLADKPSSKIVSGNK